MTTADEAAGGRHDADASEGGAGAPPDPITVEWYAGRCIHSANCVRSLRAVFDPKRRPWVEPGAATPDAIAEAVLRCPTGALRFVRHDGGAQEAPDVPTTMTPVRNGPLYVRGDVEVRGLDGAPLRRDTRVSLCRCGLARAVPFCDNTCRSVGWQEPIAPVAGPSGSPESAAPEPARPEAR
jgi:uncharacterized Fe-S cluster protein YjdI/CDGSH-type Zn-finger protein